MIEEIKDKIYKLEAQIIEQHLTVGCAEDDVDELESELESAEEDLKTELKYLEQMENELSDLQEQLETIEENGESDEFYSYGAGQTQEETLFDFIED
ncbi:hypothetical protein [Enterococcus sp. AZ126]|uniref:hypothetical protein n=1 Tax=Enterococcus sp. AZ126 TaxID=2774635 RepID=UPI003F250595